MRDLYLRHSSGIFFKAVKSTWSNISNTCNYDNPKLQKESHIMNNQSCAVINLITLVLYCVEMWNAHSINFVFSNLPHCVNIN